MNTQISGSIRPRAKSNKMKMILNFKSEHVNQIGIDSKRHIEVTKANDLYRLHFYEKQTVRSNPATIKTSGNSKTAQVYLDTAIFGINTAQTKSATSISAEYTQDGIAFKFNQDQFLSTCTDADKRLESKTIETIDQKVLAGFDPNSAWGVGFKREINKDLRKAAAETLKLKLKVIYGTDL